MNELYECTSEGSDCLQKRFDGILFSTLLHVIPKVTQPTQPCGAHRGCNWAHIWGPTGLTNWDPANFVLSFHGGPTCVSPDGLMMGP